MNRSRDERLLAFLEGELEGHEREALLEQVERDPELAAELRLAASGLESMRELQEVEAPVGRAGPLSGVRGARRVSPWWIAAAAAVTLLVSVPTTWRIAAAERPGVSPAGDVVPATGQPASPEPSFVLLLHGRWPDAGEVEAAEARRRAAEYWGWATGLAQDEILLASGDLRWEPGQRLGPRGVPVLVSAGAVADDDFVVGMFVVRADSYEEALALARECPHLRYGGSVSVRQVGAGFVTTAGFGDW